MCLQLTQRSSGSRFSCADRRLSFRYGAAGSAGLRASGARIGPYRRRGAVLPFVAICIFMMMAFAMLAIDVGHLYVVKAELQRTADNAALAGAMQLADAASVYGDESVDEKLYRVVDWANHYAGRNPAGGKAIALSAGDTLLGYLSDPYNRSLSLDTTADPTTFNVVQVTTRRTAASPNGPVGLFFARVFGKETSDLTATAAAVLDDHFKGIDVPDGTNSPLIPFVIKAERWQDEIVNGNGADQYSIDPDSREVQWSSDGIPEVQLYINEDIKPKKDKGDEDGDEDNEGAGNYGVLNVGVHCNAEPIVEDQITDGITAEQIYTEFGDYYVDVYNDDGVLLSYPANGNPGIKAGMKDEFEDRVGDVVGFFVYDELIGGTGNNTVFNIVGIRFGRIMLVDLTGKDKRVIVQPAPYSSPTIRTDASAPSTHGMIAKLQLIR